MFTSYGILFSPIKYHKIIFSWLVHIIEKADLWIHQKKQTEQFIGKKNIFLCKDSFTGNFN